MHHATPEVNAGHSSGRNANVRGPPEQRAQWERDLAGIQESGRNLVKQRSEEVIAALVQQQHIRGSSIELARALKTAEAGTHYHHASPRAGPHATGNECRHLNSSRVGDVLTQERTSWLPRLACPRYLDAPWNQEAAAHQPLGRSGGCGTSAAPPARSPPGRQEERQALRVSAAAALAGHAPVVVASAGETTLRSALSLISQARRI